MRTILRRLAAAAALTAMTFAWHGPAGAAPTEQQLVDQARITVEQLRADPDLPHFATLLERAKAVLVLPELVKAGLVFGGEGGEGVLLARHPETGAWSPPAFYTMASASIGLQLGAQVSKVMFLIMTDGGLEAVMSHRLTLGADASVAAGPVGGGVEAGTTLNIDADIYSFSHTKGLFGGLSFEGAVVVPDDDANAAYYGRPVSAHAVVVGREVGNAGADGLREALAAP